MIFRILPLMVATLFAGPLNAEQAMSVEDFEAYSLGKTLYFGFDGSTYGAEEYLPGRRVRWSYLDGICKDGEWYQDGELICFTYEDDPDPQCWSFFKGEGGLVAQFENNPEDTTLYEVQQSDKPMLCLGPEIGV